MVNTLEKFYICKKTETDNQMNYKCTIRQNIIFDTLILKDAGRG